MSCEEGRGYDSINHDDEYTLEGWKTAGERNLTRHFEIPSSMCGDVGKVEEVIDTPCQSCMMEHHNVFTRLIFHAREGGYPKKTGQFERFCPF